MQRSAKCKKYPNIHTHFPCYCTLVIVVKFVNELPSNSGRAVVNTDTVS